MENKKIGIKIADGSFYPILDGDAKQKKRMILTTVKDGQESVQIDLYRGAGETLEDAQYIGSLMVENISPAASGEAEIELDLGIDEDGQLESVAMDKASGAKQSLSVSLKNLEEEGLYDVPDFSFEDEETEELTEEELPDFAKEDILDEDLEMEELEEPSGEEEFGDLEEESLEEPFEEPMEEPLGEMSRELETETFDMDLEEEFGEEFGESTEFEEPEDFSGTEEEEAEEEESEEEETGGYEGLEGEPQWEQEYTRLNEGFEEDSTEEEEKRPSRTRPLLVALLVILALALIGALLYLFVFVSAEEETTPPLQAQQEQEAVAESPEPAAPEAEEPDVQEPAVVGSEAEGPGAEAASDQGTGPVVPSATAEGARSGEPGKDKVEYTGGVWYKIRWGDTLWEISSSFYDNPWLYDQIADENEIPNPDQIFAEDSIFIPKR